MKISIFMVTALLFGLSPVLGAAEIDPEEFLEAAIAWRTSTEHTSAIKILETKCEANKGENSDRAFFELFDHMIFSSESMAPQTVLITREGLPTLYFSNDQNELLALVLNDSPLLSFEEIRKQLLRVTEDTTISADHPDDIPLIYVLDKGVNEVYRGGKEGDKRYLFVNNFDSGRPTGSKTTAFISDLLGNYVELDFVPSIECQSIIERGPVTNEKFFWADTVGAVVEDYYMSGRLDGSRLRELGFDVQGAFFLQSDIE